MHACLVAQSCPTLCILIGCSHQAPLSMGFSRQEYWNGLPCPLPGDLQIEGTQGSLPQPEKDLKSLSSMRLEARFAYGRRLLGTNGGSLWLWCCLAQPGALGPAIPLRPALSLGGQATAWEGSIKSHLKLGRRWSRIHGSQVPVSSLSSSLLSRK